MAFPFPFFSRVSVRLLRPLKIRRLGVSRSNEREQEETEGKLMKLIMSGELNARVRGQVKRGRVCDRANGCRVRARTRSGRAKRVKGTSLLFQVHKATSRLCESTLPWRRARPPANYVLIKEMGMLSGARLSTVLSHRGCRLSSLLLHSCYLRMLQTQTVCSSRGKEMAASVSCCVSFSIAFAPMSRFYSYLYCLISKGILFGAFAITPMN